MEYLEAEYRGSFPGLDKCPAPRLPEYAFIGRSNVGKSSLINLLTGRKNLAHVSKKPGKTLAINFYEIEKSWFLVDLPGYGYAARDQKTRRKFGEIITDYLSERPSISCIFVLIDPNVPPQEHDLEFLNWLGDNELAFVLVYTKTDRMTRNQLNANLAQLRTSLLESWNELPQEFLTSAEQRLGRQEILNFIQKTNAALVVSQ